ncbi:MAG: hypothetical protein K2H34_06675 [Lachnospiraceae bacterium]|nr:hypothetical protein [Lachnospiraceae bacterium]
MAKKDHTLGKLLALTTVAAAVGGVCYIFRDQIRESAIYQKSTNTLLGLLKKLPGKSDNQENNSFSFKSENDDFSDCIFPDKKNGREYTSISINAKEDPEETNPSDVTDETVQDVTPVETISQQVTNNSIDDMVSPTQDIAPVETVSEQTTDNDSDDSLSPALDTAPVETASEQTTDNNPDDSLSPALDAAPVETVSEQVTDNNPDDTVSPTQDIAPVDAVSEQITNSNPEDALNPTQDITPNNIVQEEAASDSSEETSDSLQDDSSDKTAEDMTEIFSDEAIPIITFGGSFGIPTSTPEPATTPIWTTPDSNVETVSAYENEGLSDVSEDPDVLEEQDRLDF